MRLLCEPPAYQQVRARSCSNWPSRLVSLRAGDEIKRQLQEAVPLNTGRSYMKGFITGAADLGRERSRE